MLPARLKAVLLIGFAFLLVSAGRLEVHAERNSDKTSPSSTNSSFAELLNSFGVLETVAGNGAGRQDAVNYWRPEFEGKPATNAALSRPHYAMADRAGNIYIADKDSHSVLRVDVGGLIHTHAGTHVGGFNGDGPMPARQFQLNFPNALWIRGDGTVYVLDTDNGRVCRIATNGVATTLFQAKKNRGALDGGRMLWVSDDESLAYFGNETRIRRWTPANGVQTFASGFRELGTFYVESNSELIVADRGADRIFRVASTGEKIPLAGSGAKRGGAEISSALDVGLNGPRGIWPAPYRGYFFLLHEGCQLWYMDARNTLHLLVNGSGGKTHAGDGSYFYDPKIAKISEGRSVTVDYAGNILLCESDYGYIRRIRFQPGSVK